MRKAILKLDMLVLQVLSISNNYGYEIVSYIDLQTKGVVKIKEGVLYPILYRLVNDKDIEAYNKVVNGRKRVYYFITEDGRLTLENMKKEYKQLTKAVDNLMKGDQEE